jgi:hypothetical protein
MPDDVRLAVERAAYVSGRTVTAEINLRLKASLKAETTPPSYTAPAVATALTTLHEPGAQTKSPADPLTETDRAMLAIFRRMPVEKQLALLSLFN